MSEPERKLLKLTNNSHHNESGTSESNPQISGDNEILDPQAQSIKMIANKLSFVDKTTYIKQFFSACSITLVTAPRRFGKSTFMNTVKTFLQIQVNEKNEPILNPIGSENYKLFQKLDIHKDANFFEQHCGKHPVIYVSFKNVGGSDVRSIEGSLKQAVCEAFTEHSYLLKLSDDENKKLHDKGCEVEIFLRYFLSSRHSQLTETNVKNGLKFLSKILHTYFGKRVVVLIDDYDAPITKAMYDGMDDELLKTMICYIRDLIATTLKENEYLERALLNACCVGLAGVLPWEANTIVHYPFLQDKSFCKVYGFTAEEVQKLLAKPEFQAFNSSEVEDWYNGYKVLNDENTRIYSSWSLLNFVRKSVSEKKLMFDNYWARSDSVDILQKLFIKSEIQEPIKQLLNDEEVKIPDTEVTVDYILSIKRMIHSSLDGLGDREIQFFLKFLLDNGYLISAKVEKRIIKTVTLKIPNAEIRSEIKAKCYNATLFQKEYNISPSNIEVYTKALQSLVQVQANTIVNFANAVSKLFGNGAKLPANENELHSVLFTFAYNCQTLNTQNDKSGVQRARRYYRAKCHTSDMLVIVGTMGVIFEFNRRTGSAKDALDQIIDNQYYKIFEEEGYKHVQKKIFVGLHLDDKRKVTVHYLEDSLDTGAAQDAVSNVKY